jgi:hypothetical protein
MAQPLRIEIQDGLNFGIVAGAERRVAQENEISNG